MVKRELIDFIDRVEQKAIKSVEDRFDKQIENKRAEKLEIYTDKINQLQDVFNRFSTNLTLLLTDMREDKEVSYNGSDTIRRGQICLSDIKEKIKYGCGFQGEVQKLKDAKNKEIKEVKANYHKVRVVSKSMSSAKKIAEYLEGLGFDLSSLKEDEMKSLVADIDKSKLFVCGERR